MPPKRQKQFSHHVKKSKEAQQPVSETEFLEAADEFEASAGKWKAGDAARAVRFYNRAISTYDEGLKKYPKSFDLAYNKALLLYNIAQDKRIMSQIGSSLDMLKEALDAHKYALSIDQENADVLFNTAQVLTSFAEELNDMADDEDNVKSQCVSLLQEAVELFNACLSRQEMEYSEIQELISQGPQNITEIQAKYPESEKISSDSPTIEPEEWATVKEPVTPNTLVETALAQLGSLSSLATISAPTSSSLLANLTEIAGPIVTQRLPGYLALLPTSVAKDPNEPDAPPFLSVSSSSSTFHAREKSDDNNPQASARAAADLAIAVFTVAIAGAEYRSKLCDIVQYYERVTQAFAPLLMNAGLGTYPENSHVPIHSAYADALVEFAEYAAKMEDQDPSPDALARRWTALETAQAQLTEATNKLPDVLPAESPLPTKAEIYFTRANVELMRRRLSQAPSASSAIKANEKILLKNAGVYYRGTAALAKRDGNAELEKDASERNKIIQALEQGLVKDSVTAIKEYFEAQDSSDIAAIADEMAEDDLLFNDRQA
ncbi:uncharacterized protein PV09_00719 [Verruconis gallopava]|uniref:Uncharacterized protein n=1 Tax=Verruconis gallopava TaxID=253628 RepID=A0A0D2BBN8_9PEZI|nr:uncharacterized protein PV09_00719 [Verruconis gallopava]KIW08784.1 hypothetical protein PV09_00719 [Verruconis gallopava]